MHKIVVANQKGGIGKTSLCINVSACLAKSGKRVLLIDLDPQGNSTLGLGIDVSNKPTVAELFSYADCEVNHVIQKTYIPTLDILPADISLAVGEDNLSKIRYKEFVLRNKLKEISYDYILIDTAPSFNNILINAFLFCDHIIIPMNLHFYAQNALETLLKAINTTNAKLGSLINHKILLLGVVFNFFKTQSNISKNILKELESALGNKIFLTAIRENVKIMESQKLGISVLDHDKNGISTLAFKKLTIEIIKRVEKHGSKKNKNRP